MNRGSDNLLVVLGFNAFHPSMRPRFMNRGSRLGPAITERPLAPSMRPRFMNRGSLAVVPVPVEHATLQ